MATAKETASLPPSDRAETAASLPPSARIDGPSTGETAAGRVVHDEAPGVATARFSSAALREAMRSVGSIAS